MKIYTLILQKISKTRAISISIKSLIRGILSTKKSIPFFYIVLSYCSYLPLFAQNVHYVSPTGDNNNSGTESMPWETAQYALDQLSAGDSLYFRAGTYNEKIAMNQSGTVNASIYLLNYPNETAVLDGTGITNQNAILLVSDQSNIVIDGLEIQNSIQNYAQGVLIEGACANITIRNCKIHDIHFSVNPNANVNSNKNSQPLIVYGTNGSTAISNLLIENNEVYDSRTGHSEGLAVNGNVDGFQIINNLVYDLTNIGIDAIGHEGSSPNAITDQARNGLIKGNTVYNCIATYATSGGIYIDGGKDIVVENNVSYHNGYGIEIGCENQSKTTDNIIVKNNLFYDNEVAGLAMGGFNYPSTGKVENSTIRNNTFFKNDFEDNYTGEMYLSYSENCVIENNIFYTTNQNTLLYAEQGQPNLVLDHNLIYCPGGSGSIEFDFNGTFNFGFNNWQAVTGQAANSVFGNPDFVNINLSSPDFHLQTGSPAIDAGNPATTISSDETDLDQESRLAGSTIDMGVDEYGSMPINQTIVQAKVFLEACYFGSGMMSTPNSFANLVANTQPFNQSPWWYAGTETANSIPNEVIDWMLVELRDAADTSFLAAKAALLLNDGRLVDVDYLSDNSTVGVVFSTLPASNPYFVVVRHRNHLAVISHEAVSLPNAIPHDFTQANQIMGGAAQLKDFGDGHYGLFAGDFTADGVLTVSDFNGFQTQSSLINQYLAGDFNMDGNVTVSDYNLYLSNSSIIGFPIIRY